MPTRNVNLTDRFDKFITRMVDSGEFSNASEVVREGLRLVEQRQKEQKEKLRWLREAAAVGIREIENGQFNEGHSREELSALLLSLMPLQHEDAELSKNSNRRRGEKSTGC